MKSKAFGILIVLLIVVGIIVGFSLLYTDSATETMDGLLVYTWEKL